MAGSTCGLGRAIGPDSERAGTVIECDGLERELSFAIRPGDDVWEIGAVGQGGELAGDFILVHSRVLGFAVSIPGLVAHELSGGFDQPLGWQGQRAALNALEFQANAVTVDAGGKVDGGDDLGIVVVDEACKDEFSGTELDDGILDLGGDPTGGRLPNGMACSDPLVDLPVGEGVGERFGRHKPMREPVFGFEEVVADTLEVLLGDNDGDVPGRDVLKEHPDGKGGDQAERDAGNESAFDPAFGLGGQFSHGTMMAGRGKFVEWV